MGGEVAQMGVLLMLLCLQREDVEHVSSGGMPRRCPKISDTFCLNDHGFRLFGFCLTALGIGDLNAWKV